MTQTSAARIYKPLHQLKYAYESRSKPTTLEAAVSTELPSIVSKSRSCDDEHSTSSHRYKATINEILKMKLECAHVYNQIFLIDSCMKQEEIKYQEATSKHEHFVRAFNQFLAHQYERVKTVLAELSAHEEKTARTKANLNQLEQRVVEKSLKIYEVERLWRKYKVSQNFLLHIASLLKRERSVNEFRTFNVDPDCDTPSLDDLVRNFEKHALDDLPFEAVNFEHVTAERLFDYLNGLRKQNLRLLDLKLRYEDAKEAIKEEKKCTERECEEREVKVVSDIRDIKSKIEDKIAATELARMKVEASFDHSDQNVKRKLDLQHRVEMLYERCFGASAIKGSHMQMMKCVEDHCLMLLNTLNTFDPHILKKITR